MANVVLQIFDELINKHINTLVSGRVADFPEFKQIIGRIQGLNEARSSFIELLKKDEEDDDTL